MSAKKRARAKKTYVHVLMATVGAKPYDQRTGAVAAFYDSRTAKHAAKIAERQLEEYNREYDRMFNEHRYVPGPQSRLLLRPDFNADKWRRAVKRLRRAELTIDKDAWLERHHTKYTVQKVELRK